MYLSIPIQLIDIFLSILINVTCNTIKSLKKKSYNNYPNLKVYFLYIL